MKVLMLIFFLFQNVLIAQEFYDDFQDSSLDRWWLGHAHAAQYLPPNDLAYGNWRVEDGILLQDAGPDHIIALFSDVQYETQNLSARIRTGPSSTAGYAGLTFWYKDTRNFSAVFIYPNRNEVTFVEVVNGHFDLTSYAHPVLNDNEWYQVKVFTDSNHGQVSLYIDGAFFASNQMTTSTRIGRSGLYSGNLSSSFDNFKVMRSCEPISVNFESAPIPTDWELTGHGFSADQGFLEVQPGDHFCTLSFSPDGLNNGMLLNLQQEHSVDYSHIGAFAGFEITLSDGAVYRFKHGVGGFHHGDQNVLQSDLPHHNDTMFSTYPRENGVFIYTIHLSNHYVSQYVYRRDDGSRVAEMSHVLPTFSIDKILSISFTVKTHDESSLWVDNLIFSACPIISCISP